MSIEFDTVDSPTENYESYRAPSTAAVASVIVGELSCLAILDWVLVPLPLIGAGLAVYAAARIKRHPDEYSGLGLAKTGLALSLLFLVVGPAWLTYVFMTEVPDGYQRVTYAELQPNPAVANQEVPPAAFALEGKKIFIKGYVFPGQQRFGIQHFLLVRDQGDCCFGGNPRITDRINVTLDGALRLNFAPRMFKVAGTFHVEPQSTAIDGAKGGVLYHLQADHLE